MLALGVVVPQAAIVVAIQSRINQRVRERVQALRDASDRISESEMTRVEDAVVADFQDAFESRRKIFVLQAVVQLCAQARLSAAGAVGILFLGGWLVLNGRSDVGTVVASLTGADADRTSLARARELLRERQHGARAVCDARAATIMPRLPALTSGGAPSNNS